MATVFCGECGHVFARAGEVGAEWHTEPHACPGCGASPAPIMTGFADMSHEDIQGAINPDSSIDVMPGETLASAMQRAIGHTQPPDALYTREYARWYLARIIPVMAVSGALVGGVFYSFRGEWLNALMAGVLAAFVAAWICDRILTALKG